MNISAIVQDEGWPVGEATARRILAQEHITVRNIDGVENHDHPDSNLFYVELEPALLHQVELYGLFSHGAEGGFMIMLQDEDQR